MMTLNESGLTFIPEIHYYEGSDGKPRLSVTELLRKHGLGRDFTGIDKDVLDKAAARGTAIHKLIEDFDNGTDPSEMDSPYMEDLCSYLSLVKKHSICVEKSEYMVCNDILAGSIDKVLSDGSIADIKTCSALDRDALDTYRWQLSIYSYLFRKLNPAIEVPHLYLIWVRGSKNRLVEVPPIPEDEIEHLLSCERASTPETPVKYSPLSDFMDGPTEILDQDKLRHYVQYEREIADFDEQIKKLKALRDSLGLCQDMLDSHTPSAVFEDAKIALVEGQVRSSVDSKKLKDSYPDIYSELLKTSEVKPFIKITFTRK